MNESSVVFVGGPWDGEIHAIPNRHAEVEVIENDGLLGEFHTKTRYIIVPLFGDQCVWRVGYPTGDGLDKVIATLLSSYAGGPVSPRCEAEQGLGGK